MLTNHVVIIKNSCEPSFINKVEQILKKHELDYDIHFTHYQYHGKQYIESLTEACRVYVIGGDGLIHDCVQALANSHHELVAIPYGTGNDFVRNLTSKKDSIKILEQSFNLKSHKIDLLKLNQLYCVNQACCCYGSYIAEQVNKSYNKKTNTSKYMIQTLKLLSKIKAFKTTISHNGEILFDEDLLIASFNNGGYFGGGILINKNVQLSDSLFNVTIIKKLSLYEIIKYLPLLFLNKYYLLSNRVKYDKPFKQLQVECSQAMSIDGEQYPAGSYEIKVVEEALNVVMSMEGK